MVGMVQFVSSFLILSSRISEIVPYLCPLKLKLMSFGCISVIFVKTNKTEMLCRSKDLYRNLYVSREHENQLNMRPGCRKEIFVS